MNRKTKNALEYILFILPMVAIYVLIGIVPFFDGIRLSMTDWNGVSSKFNFVGLSNYVKVFSDAKFWKSFLFSFRFAGTSVLLVNLLGLAFALALSTKLKSRNALRTIFFLPQLLGGLVIGYIWKFIFGNVLPQVAENLSLDFLKIKWFTTPSHAFLALLIVFVWQFSGYLMIIYIAAIQGVPHDTIEAAQLDGASYWQSLVMVILPQIKHSIVICLFLALTTALKMYDLNVALTGGGPFNSTMSATLYIYREAFKSNRFSYAATEGVLFSLGLILVTGVRFISTKRRDDE